MSGMKRYLEDLSVLVSEAVYEECFDMPDYLDNTEEEVEEYTFMMLADGKFEDLLDYLTERVGDEKDYPKTHQAIAELSKWTRMRENRRLS